MFLGFTEKQNITIQLHKEGIGKILREVEEIKRMKLKQKEKDWLQDLRWRRTDSAETSDVDAVK